MRMHPAGTLTLAFVKPGYRLFSQNGILVTPIWIVVPKDTAILWALKASSCLKT